MKLQAIHRLTLLGMCVMLAACEPIVDRRGHIEDETIASQVEVGTTTKNQVQLKFGSPSSVSTFGDETWYYIRTRKETSAFFRPEITDQNVTRLVFDDSGTLSAIKEYELKDGQEVVLVDKTTPTEGHSMGFMEQVLGNLGRFNRPREIAKPGGR